MVHKISEEKSLEGRAHIPARHHDASADEALRVFEAFGGKPSELDAATSKRLLRRINIFMMPVSILNPPFLR